MDACPQDARVREFALRNFPARAPRSPEKTFNSKKIPGRIGRSDFHEKGPVSASKIDLDRSASTIDGLQIERRKITRRDDFHVRNQSRKFSRLKHLNWPMKRIAVTIGHATAGAMRNYTNQRNSQLT